MSLIHEKWLVRLDTWLEKDQEIFHTIHGFSLVGYHGATREKLHEYTGFTSIEEVERFAIEHLIDIRQEKLDN